MIKNIGRFSSSDRILRLRNTLLQRLDLYLLITGFLGFVAIMLDLGFEKNILSGETLRLWFSVILILLLLSYLSKVLLSLGRIKIRVSFWVELVILMALLLISLSRFVLDDDIVAAYKLFDIAKERNFINLVLTLVFIIQLSRYSLTLFQYNISPPLLFIGSFLVLIIIGTGLLLLPQATTESLSLIDALFTATSAVCVTGLIVVDTATRFTLFGKSIILILFQVGGLGFMTFSSFFGFFARGSYSLQNQLFLRDFINEESIGQITSTLFRIIFFTLFVEIVGAILIFLVLDFNLFENFYDKVRFAVFHSVSAFCNAGFSTLTNGLYEEGIRDNYLLHTIVAFIIIIGGIGFPVMINFYTYFRHVLSGTTRLLFEKVAYQHSARLITTNSKIVLATTGVLLLIGFFTYFFFEYDATLAGLPWYGKIATSFFGAVTPRTAGFNTVDMAALSLPTILIYLLLMWIGASPGSTGGGLKTTTFAVAVLNALSIAKGKNRLEIFQREIMNESVRKAFSIMLMSFLIIGTAIFLISYFEKNVALETIAFECFSAFSTVGLSLGLTGSLSTGSKLVIIVTMFIGRIGILTLMVAFFRKVSSMNYRYPEESVFIS